MILVEYSNQLFNLCVLKISAQGLMDVTLDHPAGAYCSCFLSRYIEMANLNVYL